MARREHDEKIEMYRVYVTDALRAAYKLNKRYADLVNPAKEVECTETSEEIIARISAGLGAL